MSNAKIKSNIKNLNLRMYLLDISTNAHTPVTNNNKNAKAVTSVYLFVYYAFILNGFRSN